MSSVLADQRLTELQQRGGAWLAGLTNRSPGMAHKSPDCRFAQQGFGSFLIFFYLGLYGFGPPFKCIHLEYGKEVLLVFLMPTTAPRYNPASSYFNEVVSSFNTLCIVIIYLNNYILTSLKCHIVHILVLRTSLIIIFKGLVSVADAFLSGCQQRILIG